MIAAVVFDLPDLAIGRMYSTVRAVLPDMRQNIRTMAQTLPVGSMLMARRPAQRGAPPGGPADPDPQRVGLLRPHHARAHRRWSSPPSRAPRCCGCPGGHSWMLARPQGQADILTHLVQGEEFMAQVEDRWRQLTPREYTLRAVN